MCRFTLLTWRKETHFAEDVAALVQVDFLPDVFPGAKGHSGFLEVRSWRFDGETAEALRRCISNSLHVL